MTVGRLGAAGGLLLQEDRRERGRGGSGRGWGEKKHARQNIIRESCTNDFQTTKSWNIEYCIPSPAVVSFPSIFPLIPNTQLCVYMHGFTWESLVVVQEAHGPVLME